MEITEIIDFLQRNELTEVEEIAVEEDFAVLKFYYDFDKDEIEAARSYANEESDLEEDSENWYSDWYLSYLIDVANDNISEIFEEADEEFEIASMYKVMEGEAGSNEYIKFIAVLCTDSFDGDLEEILEEYKS